MVGRLLHKKPADAVVLFAPADPAAALALGKRIWEKFRGQQPAGQAVAGREACGECDGSGWQGLGRCPSCRSREAQP